MKLTLIDTSCWTHALRRKGDPAIRQRVQALLDAGEAAWCDMIRLELWKGAANDWDRRLMRHLEDVATSLMIDERVWSYSIDLAQRCRSAALTVPTADLVIFSVARVFGHSVLHADKHFDAMAEVVDRLT